jgi:hypothetical protein
METWRLSFVDKETNGHYPFANGLTDEMNLPIYDLNTHYCDKVTKFAKSFALRPTDERPHFQD